MNTTPTPVARTGRGKGNAGAVVLAALVLLPAAIWFSSSRPGQDNHATDTNVVAGLTGKRRSFHSVPFPDQGAATTIPDFVTGLEHLPASLRGTQVDGELKLDTRGNLIVDIELKYLFDYFLGTLGEEPLPTVVARIRAFLRHHLPTTATGQAEKHLDAYLAYLHALDDLQASGPLDGNSRVPDTEALRERMAQMKTLRKALMDPVAVDAFFAAEDAYNEYTFSRIDLFADTSLSPTEKAARGSALIDSLPPALAENLRAVETFSNLRTLTEEWQQLGGTPSELRRMREAAAGPAAADRLEALDTQRAAWKSRVAAYLKERSNINAAAFSDADKATQIQILRDTHFTAREQLRLSGIAADPDGST